MYLKLKVCEPFEWCSFPRCSFCYQLIKLLRFLLLCSNQLIDSILTQKMPAIPYRGFFMCDRCNILTRVIAWFSTASVFLLQKPMERGEGCCGGWGEILLLWSYKHTCCPFHNICLLYMVIFACSCVSMRWQNAQVVEP